MTVAPPRQGWPRADVLALIGIVVAVIAIVVGATFAIAVPEIRCKLGLDKCPATADNWTGIAHTIGQPLSGTRMPYNATLPAPVAPAGVQPEVLLTISELTNQGKPVQVGLSGRGFYAYSSVDIVWSRPDGKTAGTYAAQTDDRGLFDYALLWRPDPELKRAGNDGGWTVRVTDRTSGWDDAAQLTVHSDDGTPDPDSWPEPKASAFRPASVRGGTSGALCDGTGAFATINLEGYTPDARVRLEYRSPSNEVVLTQGVRVDGQGRVTVITLWRSASCTESVYQARAIEDGTNRTATGAILLRPKP
ncbi:hypothetical protein JIG36_22640 [Actinoplanes sp. LDG1-06]|uniref:Uncharacterized protein n=1 Tax=Paractinoplanes ovalisporus TaxID=2810368 RepID=A0ABS2AEV7_9ACTN|nr:hypothetical protein [Actinoplanes ovalisporus]MBM2618363.1 hypothetical protein [Actinoplanes ovalisporus]